MKNTDYKRFEVTYENPDDENIRESLFTKKIMVV